MDWATYGGCGVCVVGGHVGSREVFLAGARDIVGVCECDVIHT